MSFKPASKGAAARTGQATVQWDGVTTEVGTSAMTIRRTVVTQSPDADRYPPLFDRPKPVSPECRSVRDRHCRDHFPLHPLHGAAPDADQCRHLQYALAGAQMRPDGVLDLR